MDIKLRDIPTKVRDYLEEALNIVKKIEKK